MILEAEVRSRSEVRDRKEPAPDDEWEQVIYRESLGISADGYVYHPNLLDYSVAGAIGLVQSRFSTNREDTDDRSDSGSLLEHDVVLRFLRKTRVPFSVYSRRHESLEPRPFLSPEVQTRDEKGFFWQFVDTKSPLSVRYDRTDLEFDPLGGGAGANRIDEQLRTKRTEQLHVHGEYNFERFHRLKLDFERRSVREDPFDIDYDIDDLRVSHQIRFGSEDQHELFSTASRFDQTGSIDLQQSQLRERLSLQHTDDLRSWYDLELTERSQRGLSGQQSDDETVRVGANVEHKLYESLVSQAGGWLENQSFGDGVEIDRHALRAQLDYKKKNPAGVLTAGYSIEHQTVDRSGGRQIIEVIDLKRTFVDPDPIVLNEPRIITDSFVITDTTGLVFYKRGLDYKVVKFANRVELHRVPTGNILDGQTVLIDYEIDNRNDFTIDTLAQRFSLRQDFTFGLSPYYRLEVQDQDVEGENAGGTLAEDITANIFGVDYRKGLLHLAAEYRDHDSSLAPYRSWLVSGDISHRFDYGATASLGARWSDISYTGARPRDASFTSVEARYTQALGENLTLEGSARYLLDRDTASTDNDGFDLHLALEWLFRRSKLTLNLFHGMFQSEFTDSRSTALFLRWEMRF